MNRQGDIISEMFKHGYDNEDDAVTEFVKECRYEFPDNSYTYFVTKSIEV